MIWRWELMDDICTDLPNLCNTNSACLASFFPMKRIAPRGAQRGFRAARRRRTAHERGPGAPCATSRAAPRCGASTELRSGLRGVRGRRKAPLRTAKIPRFFGFFCRPRRDHCERLVTRLRSLTIDSARQRCLAMTGALRCACTLAVTCETVFVLSAESLTGLPPARKKFRNFFSRTRLSSHRTSARRAARGAVRVFPIVVRQARACGATPRRAALRDA